MAVMTLDVAALDGGALDGEVLDGAAPDVAVPGAPTLDAAVPARRRVGELMAQLRGAAVELADVVGGQAGLPASERHRLLPEVDRVMAVLTSARAGLLIAERDAGTWQGSGDRSLEAWLGRTSGSGARAAHGQVQQAETLSRMTRLRDAAQDGSISIGHVDALSKVAARVPESVRQELASAKIQQQLVAIARRVDAGEFARSAARLAAQLDPAAHERGHQAQRAARYLHLTEAPDGVHVKGLLDSMAGHRLRLALEAASPRPGLDDDRTSEQRRADALSVLAEAVLTSPETTSGASVRPHVSMHLTEQTWAALREHHRQVEGSGSGDLDSGGRAGVSLAGGSRDGGSRDRGGRDGGSRDGGSREGRELAARYEPVTLDDGTPVPLSEVARVLCDCELTRVVIDAAGVVVDLGRSHRTYTGPQRRAVVARDRACAWPGCHGNARWAEVHHIRWWDRDSGPTSVENGVLLCSFHHHEVHRRDLMITRRPRAAGSVEGGPPPGAEPSPGGEPSPGREPPATGASPDGVPYVTYIVCTPDGRLVAPR